MSVRRTLGHETEKETPVGQGENPEPINTDEGIPADNRYAPASGILAPICAPMSGAQ
jgi:hypothetical protein